MTYKKYFFNSSLDKPSFFARLFKVVPKKKLSSERDPV